MMSKTYSPQHDKLSAQLRAILAGNDSLNTTRLQTAVNRLAEAALRCSDAATPDPHGDDRSEKQNDCSSQQLTEIPSGDDSN